MEKFYGDYGVAGLLRACQGEKQKGFSAFRIFQYLLCLVFSDRMIRPLTGKERKDIFIIDDTLFARTGGKKAELCSKVCDHVSMKYRRGYRLLALGWSDGNSFLPIAERLLASGDEKNMIGPRQEVDKHSLAEKRRKQATSKAPEVMVEMLKTALRAGHRAKNVLLLGLLRRKPSSVSVGNASWIPSP